MQRNLSSGWVLHRPDGNPLFRELDQGDNTSESWGDGYSCAGGEQSLVWQLREQNNSGISLSQCVKAVG